MTEQSEDKAHEAGFLARWSERKKQTQLDEPKELQTPLPENDKNTIAGPLPVAEGADLQEIEVLTDEDMPPIESLGESSDFGGFLSPGVSDALRKAAMKKLFALPSCGVLDGLNDYDDDYTVFEPLGDIVTADMSYRAAVDAEREAKKAAEKLAALSNSSPEDQDGIAQLSNEDILAEHSEESPESEDSPKDSAMEVNSNNTSSLPDRTVSEEKTDP